MSLKSATWNWNGRVERRYEMRVGVFGGTFDPIHLGHLILAETAREQLQLGEVRFVPAGDPWRKAARDVTPAMRRLEMVRLAVQGNDAFVVDDCEIQREGPSYTIETLRLIKSTLSKEAELFLLLGEDALADMPAWRDPSGIAGEAWIAVAPRQGTLLQPLPFDEGRLLRIEMPYVAISATELRRRAKEGLSLRYLVPPAVEAYIKERRLYRD